MKIREATSKDTDSIIKLLEELGRPLAKNKVERKKFEELVLQYVLDKDKRILLAEDNYKILGMVSIVFLLRLNQNESELWIPDLVVSKEYQNKGIGKELVKTCIKIAKKKNCFRMRLESGNERKNTHQFYKKNGFEQYALTFRKHIEIK